MRVDWALACRRVRWTAEAADVYGAGRNTFWRPGLPADVALPVVVRVAAPEIECGPEVEHRVEGYLLGPGMAVLDALEFGLGIVSFFVRIGESPYRDPGAREIAL